MGLRRRGRRGQSGDQQALQRHSGQYLLRQFPASGSRDHEGGIVRRFGLVRRPRPYRLGGHLHHGAECLLRLEPRLVPNPARAHSLQPDRPGRRKLSLPYAGRPRQRQPDQWRPDRRQPGRNSLFGSGRQSASNRRANCRQHRVLPRRCFRDSRPRRHRRAANALRGIQFVGTGNIQTAPFNYGILFNNNDTCFNCSGFNTYGGSSNIGNPPLNAVPYHNLTLFQLHQLQADRQHHRLDPVELRQEQRTEHLQ